MLPDDREFVRLLPTSGTLCVSQAAVEVVLILKLVFAVLTDRDFKHEPGDARFVLSITTRDQYPALISSNSEMYFSRVAAGISLK